MFFLKLVLRNAFRARLRAALTVLGLVIAVVAFGLLQTLVHAWYAGVETASERRLIARNAISLVFPLPAYYRERIRAVEGVKAVTINEPFFQGHFPGHPVMPGVLQVEAMAQVASILMLRKPENQGKIGYFMSANEVKFRRPVVPGDIVATIFHALGLDHASLLPGPAGRPFPLSDFGTAPISELF